MYCARSDQDAERFHLLARRAFPDAAIFYCPSSDALGFDALPPSPANAGRRVAALGGLVAALERGENPLLICGAEATVPRYAPPSAFQSEPPLLRVGDKLDLHGFRERLIALGYYADDRIDEPGEIGEVGTVLDIYPVDAEQPVRVEMDGDIVRSIRSYDPLTQISSMEHETQAFGIASEPAAGRDGVSILDHVTGATTVIDPAFARARRRYVALDREMAPSGRSQAIATADWEAQLADFTIGPAPECEPTPLFADEAKPLPKFAAFVDRHRAAGRRIIVAGSERDCRFLARRLSKLPDMGDLPIEVSLATAATNDAPLSLATVPLGEGAIGEHLVLASAHDLLGSRAQGEQALSHEVAIDPLAIALRMGDAVVHDEFGVGFLRGLRPLDLPGEGSTETIEIEYAKSALRQVPVTEADRLWRYGGDENAVKPDTLDGKSWARRRIGIDAAIATSARHLRAMAKERSDATAPKLRADETQYEQFVDGFAYSETADQHRGIEAIRHDLASGKPMDRLVIGDVGYGKTELALRAAAITVLAGMQVAMVAPTTLLASQHFEEFQRRFARIGVEVAQLSGASTSAQKRAVKCGLADGTIQVVIGTTAIAAKAVSFAKLGLMVIDEEQRFGAAQKEKLEALGAGHVLRLSATPIPRTLQSAMIGLNELSLITTPPARRLPIRTFLGDFDAQALQAALQREHGRKGQSFVVVPRIKDMAPAAELLQSLVPKLDIVTVHGKMASSEADAALLRFSSGEGDVLLATSIIETGLDVPRANTMAIIGCARFGLGQLHQLRGRVGRSARRAHVLMFGAPGKSLTDRTRARLNQLVAQSALGAGFAVAANDLDMRGAGDLTSDEQSGHMKLIGLELYQHLLTGTLRELAGETPPALDPENRTARRCFVSGGLDRRYRSAHRRLCPAGADGGWRGSGPLRRRASGSLRRNSRSGGASARSAGAGDASARGGHCAHRGWAGRYRTDPARRCRIAGAARYESKQGPRHHAARQG